jgi:peptidoglycan biosynthesis protein MviN/MurJ (putative lipid II flippase)
MLAFVNLGTGVVNLALSVVLIKPFGLPGVAWGTLLPIAVSSAFVLYPAACRRAGLSVGYAFMHSVLPAVWPAALVGLLLLLTRSISTGTLLAVVLQAAAGGVLYLALFFAIAIGRRDRALYTAKALELVGRRRLATV